MREHGEVSDDEEAADAGEPVALSSQPDVAALVQQQQQQQELVVGYALTKKKVKSFLQPKLLALARKKGIHFVPIDEACPLSEQGPFDIILHKLRSKEWHQVLEDYREEHPEVTVLDPPSAIKHLHNRQSMLQEVADLNLSNVYGEVCTPRQLVIMKDPSSIPDAVAKAGLTLPLAPLGPQNRRLPWPIQQQQSMATRASCSDLKGKPHQISGGATLAEWQWILGMEVQRRDLSGAPLSAHVHPEVRREASDPCLSSPKRALNYAFFFLGFKYCIIPSICCRQSQCTWTVKLLAYIIHNK